MCNFEEVVPSRMMFQNVKMDIQGRKGEVFVRQYRRKIRVFAMSLTTLGIILSVILGIVVMNISVLAGILVMGIGALISWVSSLTLYGFGEIIEHLALSNNNTYAIWQQLKRMMPEEEKKDKPSVPIVTRGGSMWPGVVKHAEKEMTPKACFAKVTETINKKRHLRKG